MTRILIVGIGGVGGYFGGLLSKSLKDRKDYSICFMARGEHLKAIREKGLLVTKGENEFIAYPDIASDNPSDFGQVDYIIICTKSYDIEEILDKISSCVKKETVFLPLLNGVDSSPRIKTMFPHNLVADGCAYIVARRTAPGHVQNLGYNQRIAFGIENTDDNRLDFLFDTFKLAEVEATLTKEITSKIWEKYAFISTTASITSYYNKTFGEIKNCFDCCKNLQQLIEEICAVAKEKNITLPTDIKDRVWKLFMSLVPETTTSMHSDFLTKKSTTEVESLTGYIVREAKKLNLHLPKYQEVYQALTQDIMLNS